MIRTLDNCILIKHVGCKPRQYDGVCEGFAKSDSDDEPCETCKECKLHYLYKEEH